MYLISQAWQRWKQPSEGSYDNCDDNQVCYYYTFYLQPKELA